MATYNKFQQFVEDLVAGVHDFDAHTFKIMLCTASDPPVATDATRSNITSELTTGSGYTSGGATVTVTVSETGGVAKVTASADVTFTFTGTVTFRYVVLYNDTPTSPADPLIAWWDYGSNVTLNSGETFTVAFDGTNGIFQLT